MKSSAESETPQRRPSADLAGIGPEAQARRASFGAVARLYDEMRPGYPAAVFDDVCAIAGLNESSRLLELGCGTGHATLPFAGRGLHIDCIELGEEMAAVARAKLAGYDGVQVTVADFDAWETGARYDLVYSASAWQWLNPETRVTRIAHLLRPSGWIAVWRNHPVRGTGVSADFFLAAQKVYARETPELAAKFTGLVSTDEIQAEVREEWLASGLLRDVQVRRYIFENHYTADEYVRMLDTHSDHRILPDLPRARLFEGLARLVEQFGGSVTREQVTLLEMAKNRD
jgi:SAM-dependent methyltransferase